MANILDLPYLEPITIKKSFVFFLAALMLAAMPAFLLRGMLSMLLVKYFASIWTGMIVILAGYVIMFCLLTIFYEFLKSGELALNVSKVWRMFMAWLKTIIFLMPTLIFAFMLLFGGAYLSNISIYTGFASLMLFGTGLIMLVFLAPVSFVLQWYWYEVGPD